MAALQAPGLGCHHLSLEVIACGHELARESVPMQVVSGYEGVDGYGTGKALDQNFEGTTCAEAPTQTNPQACSQDAASRRGRRGQAASAVSVLL